MAFIPLPFGIKLDLVFTNDGQTCMNTHWLTKTSPAAVNSTDLANAVSAGQILWNNLRVVTHTGCSLNRIVATDWSLEDGGVNVQENPTNPLGALAGAGLSNQDTVAVTLRTAKRGRSARGRFYFNGLGSSDLASRNVLSVGFATDVVLAYQAYKTAANGFGLVPCIASFFTAGAPRVTGQGTAITQVGLTDGFMDSQNRRLPGRGE